ncbi:MAG: hypothetical protein ACUVTL_11185, partial [Thermoproteota archaeon]
DAPLEPDPIFEGKICDRCKISQGLKRAYTERGRRRITLFYRTGSLLDLALDSGALGEDPPRAD